jgi:micrococcal nuclease
MSAKNDSKNLIFTSIATLIAIIGIFFVRNPTDTNTLGTSDYITPTKHKYLVTKVVDGDTIELEGEIKVRYIGIDTPEISFGKECFGDEAKAKNKKLVEGKYVTLEKDISETDKFGRLLRYVYIGDTFVNEHLVKEGYANAISYPPDIKYQEIFSNAETWAREKNKGLWKKCD